ncbi:MAG: type IV pilus assembly protein PilW [bacterium]|nr:MAG: type IV pilus assembly protein PilW [bacterium]KAF0147847.1 MAG: type IV pilus assembly protein PilW [bacterium]KAF0167449.1 MAG: type IV pilus assembly protein PilW [bacterium]TXT17822.1 MAG: type IV pilus assembly protein PilW [bacterium]
MNLTLRDRARNSRTPHHQAGLTLLEMLISISLGLLLVFGIGTIFVGSNQTYRVQEENARIQEAGRYALEIIGRNLRQAGYADISIDPVATKTAFQGTPVNGVNTICPLGTPVTDLLTVQYDGRVGEQDCQANNVNAGDIVQHTFFIENNVLRCNAVRAAAAPAPPAACPAANTGVELLNNVEDLQVLYGIDITGDQSADRYTATPANWNQVVTARVCVLVRSPNIGVVAGNQNFLNCAGALGTVAAGAAFTNAADTRLRRAFVATFNLRNRVNNLP